jgi:flagellar basal-body rod protein FlgF
MSGAIAQNHALDVVANNVANANTTGYRAERVAFGKVLANTQSQDTAYVSVTGTGIDPTAGAIEHTDNPLDLAIEGDGYFAVMTPRGVRYTRAGDFQLDSEGTLINGSGHMVVARGGGSISIPPGAAAVTIGSDGSVFADGVEVGQIEIASFDAEALRREGQNLFAAVRAPIAASVEPRVISGALERSNVNVVRGMVDLVRVSRTYQALMRMIETQHAMDARAARSLGGPK